ncbi:MAG TPA: hypothetical protein VGX25_17435 [Actinophytocola sp.]|uniref:vWA domain-containing protein n=1 Tax=Actinophytocola sp. TaxID=1872138 RepID=UPI002DDCA10E|nr:hypothetical protein [Actinophytocola sp.]HEV2781170.1 hypothetical protein [Actinophytocola sp.]
MIDYVDAVNRSLLELRRAVGDDPVAANGSRFCLIGFSRSPTVLLPLSRLTAASEISRLTTRAVTNFGAVFTFLHDTIGRDLALLEERSYRVCRPAVFFLSDGQPTDPVTWPVAFALLTDPSWSVRPNVVAFGVGDADPAIIGRIGTFRAFLGQNGVSPGTALDGFIRALISSVVRSVGPSSGDGECVLRVPDQVSGFTDLRMDHG